MLHYDVTLVSLCVVDRQVLSTCKRSGRWSNRLRNSRGSILSSPKTLSALMSTNDEDDADADVFAGSELPLRMIEIFLLP